jgi:ribosomal protein S27AE
MLVLQVEPAVALLEELGFSPAQRRYWILPLACGAAAVLADHGDLLGAEPVSVSGRSVVIRWTCGLPGSS